MRWRGRRFGRSQATVEFAFIAPLFLVCFLATVDAGLWAVQNSAEVAAVEQGARLAASAGGSPLAGSAPDARAVTAAVENHLAQALFATRVVPWCGAASAPGCAPVSCPSSPADVEAHFGPRVVAICVHENAVAGCGGAPGSPAASLYCADTPTVTVRLVGHVASLVPPGIGFSGAGAEIDADVAVTTHTLRFAP